MKSITVDDVDDQQLEAFLEEQGEVHRVGRYFEQLVHYWLVHVRGVEMLGAGLQIRDGKRTIGELDFVYRDEHGQIVHCEVSVKFFLHHARAGTSHFPGPNALDNFERKAARLFDQQLELSRQHYPSVQRRDAIVKGMAFYRGGRPRELPRRMHRGHASGAWLRDSELEQLERRAPLNAAVARKPYWLAPQVDARLKPVAALVAELRAHFDGGPGHPVMLSLRDPDTAAEVERTFVVADDWPASQQPE